MHVGIFIAITESTIHIAELAREVEARGFESLWVPEFTHVPVHRRTPLPPYLRARGAGAEPPKHLSQIFDPFITLMGAAAVTQTLKLGTGICLIIQRDTIMTAKAVASLDQLEHHGTVFKTRFQKMGEQVRAMKAIWTQDVAEFHGEFVNFEPIWCGPKPVQQPHPPVLLGGESSYTLQRVVDYGAGWLPRTHVLRQPAQLIQGMVELRERAAKAGRDMQTISVSVFGAAADRQQLETYRAAGVTRAVLLLPQPADRDTVLPLLDQYVQLLR